MQEIWKPVPYFREHYEASNLGRVRKISHGEVKVLDVKARRKNGYTHVRLANGEVIKCVSLHRIICMAFHGIQVGRSKEVAHINGDRSDNRAANLRWIDRVDHYQNKHLRAG